MRRLIEVQHVEDCASPLAVEDGDGKREEAPLLLLGKVF
jgi:hypothetical protein